TLMGKIIYFKTANNSYGVMVISSTGDSIQFSWRKVSDTGHTVEYLAMNWGFDLDGGFTDDDSKDFGLDDYGSGHCFQAHNGAKFFVGGDWQIN
ncbi:MAG: hypothetical protein IKZ86_04605, partial [Spirochaetaceae bacterium]|nr:hypothetical protein [Spirochaetaceae bacterium]